MLKNSGLTFISFSEDLIKFRCKIASFRTLQDIKIEIKIIYKRFPGILIYFLCLLLATKPASC